MKERIEYGVVASLVWLAKILSRSILYGIIRQIALLIYYAGSKRRALTIRNLESAFGEKSPQEIKKLAREVYTELSKTVTEILLMLAGRFDVDKVVVNTQEAAAQLEKIAQIESNGMIFMTAHFSNWELAAHFLGKHGQPMLVVGREGNNRQIDQVFTMPLRQIYGNQAVSKKKAMMAMIKALKKGGNIGILIDQKSGEHGSVKVDFFGREAETTTSVALLKLKFDPLVVPVFVPRQKDGRYKVIIQDPIDYRADEADTEEEKSALMTARYSDVIEAMIKEYPAQWFWMHDRWRR
jgi:KDO2-lipid IV(A) lauroyltransferase